MRIKKFFPKTLLWRSFWLLVWPVILVNGFAGYIFFQRHWREMSLILSQNFIAQVCSLADVLDQGDIKQAQNWIRHWPTARLKPWPEGLPQAIEGPRFLKRALEQQLHLPFAIHRNGSWITVWLVSQKKCYQFQMARHRVMPYSFRLFVAWALGCSLVFLCIAVFIMEKQMRPLHQLIVWARRLNHNPDETTGFLKIRGAQEIRRLTLLLQANFRRLKTTFDERQSMLLGISHDLRTPLTRLKLHLALLPPNGDTDFLKKDVDQMIGMINGYLHFARKEEILPQKMQPSLLLKEILKGYPHVISLDLPPQEIWMNADATAFQRCVQNLLDNALVYKNHRVHLALVQKKGEVCVEVHDDGPGIAEKEDEKIFKPFFRSDGSRSSGQKGQVGLGLSIVQKLMQQHRGRVSVQKSFLLGAQLTLHFPALDEDSSAF